VQSLLKSRSPKLSHPKRTTSRYLLSGLLRCKFCDRAICGHSAKSGQFLYYRCSDATKKGPSECPGHWIPKDKIENFVLNRIRDQILCPNNLMDLIRMTNEEIEANYQTSRDRLADIQKQIHDVESRLEHLFDALETGAFSTEELAPRIRKLQQRLDALRSSQEETEQEQKLHIFEMPDIASIQRYVDDLRSLLTSSTILESKNFVKSFIKEIVVGKDEVCFHYTLPLPQMNSDLESVSVLPFIGHGRPCRSRTCDTLIKRYRPSVPPSTTE
jgi:site-specific DNA recombinase